MSVVTLDPGIFDIALPTLGDPNRLSESMCRKNCAMVKSMTVDWETLTLQVEFEVAVELDDDMREDPDDSDDDVEPLMIELTIQRLENMGIPRAAQRSHTLKHDELGSRAFVDCEFVVEPQNYEAILPVIRAGLTFDGDSWSVITPKTFALTAQLPGKWAASPTAGDEEKLEAFARYMLTALSWQAQWLRNYSCSFDFQEEDDDLIVQIQYFDMDGLNYSWSRGDDGFVPILMTETLRPVLKS